MKTKSIKYGLWNTQTNQLVHVSASSNEGQEYCGEMTYKLTMDVREPLFLVDAVHHLVAVLSDDPKWYNSDQNCPCWGDCDVTPLIPVAVEVVTIVQPIKVTIPTSFSKDFFIVFEITKEKALLLAGKEELPKAKFYTACIVSIPEGKTREEVEGLVGQYLNFGCSSYRKVFAVADLPEEYQTYQKKEKKEVVLLVCGPAVYRSEIDV